MITALKNFLNENTISIFSFINSLGIQKITSPFFYKKYLKKQKNLKMSDIEKLGKQIPSYAFMFTTPELHKSNDWYGHASILKQYSHLPPDYKLKTVIEHGLFFGNYIWTQDIYNKFPYIFTFGTQRIQNLQKMTNKKIIPIGPYIYYAKPFFSKQQTEKERQRLGKNLLVFPIHSTGDSRVNFDFDSYCKEIMKIGSKFQTIRICIYWKDVQNDILKKYKKYPFELVTAGHIFDPMFLPRIKSLIDISSSTASNSVGTHIGYSIYMKKPHYLYKQKLKYSGGTIEVKRCLDIEKTSDYSHIENAFLDYRDSISDHQKNIVNMYWGLDQIKTRGELRQIFDEAERLYNK